MDYGYRATRNLGQRGPLFRPRFCCTGKESVVLVALRNGRSMVLANSMCSQPAYLPKCLHVHRRPGKHGHGPCPGARTKTKAMSTKYSLTLDIFEQSRIVAPSGPGMSHQMPVSRSIVSKEAPFAPSIRAATRAVLQSKVCCKENGMASKCNLSVASCKQWMVPVFAASAKSNIVLRPNWFSMGLFHSFSSTLGGTINNGVEDDQLN